MLSRVYVTRHALQRWRERVAEYGDAPASEVERAVLDAVPLGKGEPLPFPRLRDMRYWRHRDKADVYFATAPRAVGVEAVVTVIDISARWVPPRNPIAFKKGADPATFHRPVPSPQPLVEPQSADVRERREWLLGEYADTSVVMSRLSKRHPQRPEWSRRSQELQRKLRDCRSEWLAWRARDRDDREIVAPDGSLDHDTALRHLLAEVAHLKRQMTALLAEVEQLKAAGGNRPELSAVA